MEARRYVVVGVGAIGGAIAGLLRLSGASVVGIARGAQLDALRAGPLLLETPSRLERIPIEVVGAPSELRFHPRDVAILCTKSQHLPEAVSALRSSAPPGLPVVCAQNGVAAERLAREAFDRVYGMVVFSPVSHLEPGRVTMHSEPVLGVLDVGLHPRGSDALVERIVADLRSAGWDARGEPDISRLKYGKLLTNVGNALQALGGNGAMPLVRAVQDETIACFRAAGIEFTPLDEMSDRWREVRELPVGGAGRGGGSTWQSLARGTGNLETDYLNGEIVALAEQLGIDAPKNRKLVELARRAAAERWPPARMTPDELAAALAG